MKTIKKFGLTVAVIILIATAVYIAGWMYILSTIALAVISMTYRAEVLATKIYGQRVWICRMTEFECECRGIKMASKHLLRSIILNKG